MKMKTVCASLFAAVLGLSMWAPGISQDSMPDEMSEAASMQIQSSPEHQLLLEAVGMWDIEIEMPTGPDSPPMKMKGTERIFAVGALWIVSEFQADFGGMPFSGSATFGYDPSTQNL